MAKKLKVNKTQAVRDYLKDHPGAMSGEIATALTKQGITINAGHVANIKTKLNKEGRGVKTAVKTKVAKKKAAVEAAAPAVVEMPAKPNGKITLDKVKKVAEMIKMIGGLQHVLEVLEAIKELGGVKKFKDLAEAMTVTETPSMTATDGMPF